MWYHWLLLIVGLYFVGSSIYNMIILRNTSGWIVNGISIVAGAGLAWWAYSSATAPVIPPPMIPMTAGRRRGGRYRW